MKKQLISTITEKIKISNNFIKLKIESDYITKFAKPGNFVALRIPGKSVPFLRKPFSIYEIEKNQFSVLFRIIGNGTKQLSLLNTGEKVDVLGPLGNSFDEFTIQNKKIALIAGGIGIASLRNFSANSDKNFDLFWGAVSKDEIVEKNAWDKLTRTIKFSTNDGSLGYKGFVTDLFEKAAENYDLVITCGPNIMMEKISGVCKKKNIKHLVIMEEYMGCGFGICQGCVVNTDTGYKRTCVDGPIFLGETIKW